MEGTIVILSALIYLSVPLIGAVVAALLPGRRYRDPADRERLWALAATAGIPVTLVLGLAIVFRIIDSEFAGMPFFGALLLSPLAVLATVLLVRLLLTRR